MDIRSIMNLLIYYCALGLAALAALAAVFFAGWLIYKKAFHGSKKLSVKYLALAAVSFMYLFVAGCAVFADRAGYQESVQALFQSYRHAWYYWRSSEWMNIILNILLFVPFGFLLPFWHKRLDKIYIAVPAGFLLTLSVEVVQYLFRLGVFEWDDVFNNTIGAFLGFCAFRFVQGVARRRRAGAVLAYLVPFIAVAASFGGVFIAYDAQPYGNLQLSYYEPHSMKNVTVTVDELSQPAYEAYVYRETPSTLEDARELAYRFFDASGFKADSSTEFYDDGRYRLETSDGGVTFSMNTEDGSYDFEETAYFWMDSTLRPSTPLEPREVKALLENYGVYLPESCVSGVDEGHMYSFYIDEISGGYYYRGRLYCYIDEFGRIVGINNEVVRLEAVASEDIISVWDAVERIRNGGYTEYMMPDSYELEIKNCTLSYSDDSKGFYQPVYVFECSVISDSGTEEETILVPALA